AQRERPAGGETASAAPAPPPEAPALPTDGGAASPPPPPAAAPPPCMDRPPGTGSKHRRAFGVDERRRMRGDDPAPGMRRLHLAAQPEFVRRGTGGDGVLPQCG